MRNFNSQQEIGARIYEEVSDPTLNNFPMILIQFMNGSVTKVWIRCSSLDLEVLV